MTAVLHPPCQEFDDLAEELALGMVEEPRRSQLLDHAAGCPRCRATLDGLGSVVDRLLLVAPEVEPMAGFESRVLARLNSEVTSSRSRRVSVWAAVAASLLLLVAGFAVGRRFGDDPSSSSRSAGIVSPTGDAVGTVQLLDQPAPHVLVTVTAPRPNPGERHCQLLVDGTWVEVGTWDPADMASGVWAVGVSNAQLAATAMRIVDDAGTVLAAASFT